MKTNTLKLVLLAAALLLAGFLAQAQDKKISQLPALPSVAGNEAIPLAISGTNYYVTPTQLKTWLNIVGYVPLAGTNKITAPLTYSTNVSSLFTKYSLIDSNWAATHYAPIITAGYVPVKEGSTTIFNHASYIINDNAGLSSLEYNARTLRDNAGTVSTNWQSRLLYNNSGTDVVHYNTDCALYDNSANPSIGWHNRYMYNSSGTIIGDWSGTRFVLNADATTGLQAVTYQQLIATTSTLTALSGTGFVYQNGATTSYTTSIPNASLANSTISGVALGSNLFNHTTAYGLSGSNYNGASSQTWNVDTTTIVSKLYLFANASGFVKALSTTGTSGAASVTTGTLNIPRYDNATTLNSLTTATALATVGNLTAGTASISIYPVVGTVTTASVITINTDNYNMYTVTSLTTATTFTVPTGTPKAGQSLIIRIKSDASTHALTFSTGTNGFRFSTDAPAPTTTTASKTMYVGFRWNEADSKWDNVSPYIDNF